VPLISRKRPFDLSQFFGHFLLKCPFIVLPSVRGTINWQQKSIHDNAQKDNGHAGIVCEYFLKSKKYKLNDEVNGPNKYNIEYMLYHKKCRHSLLRSFIIG
jgi:hypothetical protein